MSLRIPQAMRAAARRLPAALVALALSSAAGAQGQQPQGEGPWRLSDAERSQENRTLAWIVIVVLAIAAVYLLRRWQAIRAIRAGRGAAGTEDDAGDTGDN